MVIGTSLQKVNFRQLFFVKVKKRRNDLAFGFSEDFRTAFNTSLLAFDDEAL